MKMKMMLYITIALVFLIIGCDTGNKETGTDEAGLRTLVVNAVNGDSSANAKLSGLINFNLPVNAGYNQLVIKQFEKEDDLYFVVCLEYPNPVYNKLGIFDQTLTPLLFDESLNGNLNAEIITVRGRPLIKMTEEFISKGTLELSRVTLYGINHSSAGIIFRAFTRLAEPGIEYEQEISSISPENIHLNISSSKASEINGSTDLFSFDEVSHTFKSKENVFNEFVTNRIKNFPGSSGTIEISDRASALLSVGLSPDVADENANSNPLFTINLNDDWQEITDFTITRYLKKQLKGTEYVNSKIGAKISVVLLPPQESAETYISERLGNKVEGNYTIRFSNKLESGKNNVIFFEYSCGEKKLLVILEASKYTFSEHREMYDKIINSLQINC